MNGELRHPAGRLLLGRIIHKHGAGTCPSDKRNYRLDRMRRLLEMFDNPDRGVCGSSTWPGTKGKGSTSALLASVLHAAGRRTGLYTSPHVGKPFRANRHCRGTAATGAPGAAGRRGESASSSGCRLRIFPGRYAPTTFELLTLLAFLYFRESGCAEAVVETGIGGRLDATNVVHSAASVITPLDLEHTDILG